MGQPHSNFFTFPQDIDKEQVKKKAKEIRGTCFKTFKGTLYKIFILKEEVPNWDDGEYAKQKELWEAFKQYKLYNDYLELSKKNKAANSLKALFGCIRIHINPHVLRWIGVELELNSTPTHTNTHMD